MDGAVTAAVVDLIGGTVGTTEPEDWLGLRVAADGRSASVFVSAEWCQPLLRAFADSGTLAMAFSEEGGEWRAVGFGEGFVVSLEPHALPDLFVLTIQATAAA